MKERPILFNSDMVCAIIEGRKTQTRRIVKEPERKDGAKLDLELLRSIGVGGACPIGQMGDRFWVRETIIWDPEIPYYKADFEPCWRIDAWCWKRKILPSIHMPRGASRITLEITDVRVERLKDISESDAKSEGVVPEIVPATDRFGRPVGARHDIAFMNLWMGLYGPESWMANPWVWVIEFNKI